ncbi:hypothetical protein [Caballeronia glebae]|uniref:hypothetical protein n=1 Tax=Caballeronia glebae TaxID=1777143 RepID=UPI000B0171AD|nr:hypothetical protein [Caballeronia glebae]
MAAAETGATDAGEPILKGRACAFQRDLLSVTAVTKRVTSRTPCNGTRETARLCESRDKTGRKLFFEHGRRQPQMIA